MKPFLFVHIPKTAGTSLHHSMIEQLGADAVQRDNGNAEEYTSDLVKHYFYNGAKDYFGYFNAFQNTDKKWLTGHVFAETLLPLFGAPNTISFVREPVERVISNYWYMHKIGRTDLSFGKFYRTPNEANKQFRMIGKTPWRAYSLVGTLDRYGECIALLSEILGLEIKEQKQNVNTSSPARTISDTDRNEIMKRNANDVALYNRVTDYLDARLTAHREKRPFCFHDTGFVPDKHIIGWAFYGQSNEPVELGLFIDGKLAKETRAIEYRATLQAIGTPRAGHNGFRFTLGDYKKASHIELRTRDTEQTLLSWSRC